MTPKYKIGDTVYFIEYWTDSYGNTTSFIQTAKITCICTYADYLSYACNSGKGYTEIKEE